MKIDLNAELKNQKGEKVNLNEIQEDKILIFVYPKDKSPGCSFQAKKYSDHADEFKNLDIKVFGMSQDSLESHQKFTESCNLKVDLLHEDKPNLLKDLNVIQKISLLVTSVNMLERSTFLIDRNTGEVLKEWRKVNPFKDAEIVLEDLKKM